jgi:hypothetical protein
MEQLNNEIHDEIEDTEQIKKESEKQAAQRASTRAKSARWDLDVAIFLFLVLIVVIVLLFQGIGIEIVAPVAMFGLACVWLVGWQRGKKLYVIYYEEELINVTRELYAKAKKEDMVQKTFEETVEERVQKALRERWDKVGTSS